MIALFAYHGIKFTIDEMLMNIKKAPYFRRFLLLALFIRNRSFYKVMEQWLWTVWTKQVLGGTVLPRTKDDLSIQ